MLSRLIKWNRERLAWHREHVEAWAGQAQLTESGLSRFQVACEAALTGALRAVDVELVNRSIQGSVEPMITARLGETAWAVWIYVDGAEVSSPPRALVRMEEWDARTPGEFIETFVARVVGSIE